MIRKITLTVFLFALFYSSVYAEGTKQLCPTPADDNKSVLQLFDNNDPNRNFMSYVAPADRRLQFTISNIGETVFLGVNYDPTDITAGATLWYRVRDASGAIVFGPIQATNIGAGSIASYAQAIAGPAALVGPGGYNARFFTPTTTGDFYIEFNRNDPDNFIPGSNPATQSQAKTRLRYFDLTVANGATIIPGRLWAKQWDITTNAAANALNTRMYIYTDDGIVSSINFNGMQPFGSTIQANSRGVSNTGNIQNDRKSVAANSVYAQYKIFLNDPDLSAFPTGLLPTFTSAVTITGCDQNNRCFNVSVDRPANIELLLNLNGVAGYQPGTQDVMLYSQILTAGATCIPWNSRDGLGNIVASGFNVPFTATLYSGLTHLPLFDVENNPNGFTIAVVRPAALPPQLMYWDDSNIPGGTINLPGCPNSCHTWSGVTPAVDWGNNRTINTWWQATVLVNSGTVTIPATLAVDANIVTGAGTGVTNAITICSDSTYIPLSGSIIGPSGIQWTSSGTGGFGNPASPTTIYTFTPLEISSGSVTLNIASTLGTCPPVTDFMVITFQQAPTILAFDMTVCANNPVANLSPMFTGATGVTWSGGMGTYSPNANTTFATYTGIAAEIFSGSANLTATTSGTGVCATRNDPMTITYTPAPTVTAGGPKTACANNPAITMTGGFTVSSGIVWTGGGGSYMPNNTAVNAVYTPTLAEIVAPTVTLTITTTGNGLCFPVTSNVTLTYTPAPLVDAGLDQSMCNSSTSTTLTGTSSGATTTNWTGGGGTFGTPAATTTTYQPSPAERAAAPTVVTLTLTANRAGCNPVVNQALISIGAAPTLTVGPNQTICSNNPAVTLASAFTVATGMNWTGGSGTFVPNNTNPNAMYTGTAAEIASTSVTLTATTVGNGTCPAQTGTVTITYTPSPTITLGTDMSACANNSMLSVTASFTVATGVNWTNGAGTVTPVSSTATTATIAYTPSAAELTAGIASLIATTANVGTCIAEDDTLIIVYTPAPTPFAGADLIMCASNPSVNIVGTAPGATTVAWSGGAGTFTPVTTLNTSYNPTAAERAALGTITLTLQGNRAGCLPVTDQVNLTIVPAPTIFAGADAQICGGDIASLNASGSPAQWTTSGSGSFSPSASVLSATYIPSNADTTAGSVTLTITTMPLGSCPIISDLMILSILPTPSISLPATYIDVTADPVIISSTIINQSSITWTTNGTGTFSNSSAASTTYDLSAADSAALSVFLIVQASSSNGCPTDNDSLELRIAPVATVVFEIPQAFSPNGDSKNDLFIVHGLSLYPKNNITFYTRDGKKVREYSDYQNNWDGVDDSGAQLPNDNYYYVFDVYDGAGKMHRHKGFVEIRRD